MPKKEVKRSSSPVYVTVPNGVKKRLDSEAKKRLVSVAFLVREATIEKYKD